MENRLITIDNKDEALQMQNTTKQCIHHENQSEAYQMKMR